MTIQKWPNGLPRSANKQFEKIVPLNDWFEIYRINEITFAFLEPNHDEEVISYLLLGSKKAVLIDTGMGISNILTEVEKITSLPIIVLNTHTHFDHTGDNFRFKAVACFDDRFELENLNKGHSNPFCKSFMQPGSYRNLPAGFNPLEYIIKPSRITRKLHHLDQLNIGNRLLVIHHTPGHSPGSICIEDKKCKLLFTGDTYYRGTVFLHLPGADYGKFVESCEYLNTIIENIEALCPGHNECYAPMDDIVLLHKTINAINRDQIEFDSDTASKFYQFDHFNLRLPLT